MSWGSPAQGSQWGSPVIKKDTSHTETSDLPTRTPDTSFHTPMLPKFGSFPMGHKVDFRRQNSSPSLGGFSTPPHSSPRPLFHSSPMNMNPRDNNINKSPRFNQGFHQRGRGMASHGRGPYSQNMSNSPFQRSYSSNASFNNPGHTGNIEDYFHPSMLQDPWRNLPATPVTQES